MANVMNISKFYRFALLGVLALGLIGCGSGGGPDPQAQAKQVDHAKNLRSYFDKANGEYTKLSDADRDAFVKLSGDETKAQQNWNLMKNGPGAAAGRGPQ